MNLNQQVNDPALDNYSRRSGSATDRPGNGFDDLGIAPNLLKGVKRLKFTKPTPIQKESIPVAIQEKDIIAIAQTGSGKTLAFGIPMLQRLANSKRGTGLVLVPTRELALQVNESLQAFCRPMNMRTVVLIGGASMALQRKDIKKNPRVIIATPGRLMDHLERRTIKLSNTEVFVLDEADRMLDMGFVPDIKKIIKSLPEKRQTMLFSATMPKEIEAIAKTLMDNPTRIEIDRSGATPTAVSHEMFLIKNHDKNRLLAVQLKDRSGPVLVFTRTKRTAKKLTATVNNLGFAAAEIHSNRSMGQRRSALDGFKRGRYQILIATDIAARGIDVSGIELVVNYDMPANSEDYVHRIGRTGRAGKTGHAISYATTAQQGWIRSLERFMNMKLAISALPTLPSEKLLLKEAEKSYLMSEPAKGEMAPKRKMARERTRSPRRGEFKRNESRPESRSDSRNGSKKSALEHIESKLKDVHGKDSKRPASKRKVSKPKNSKPAEFTPTDSNGDAPFWTMFKKKKPTKKKSVGQGARRKKRAKRK